MDVMSQRVYHPFQGDVRAGAGARPACQGDVGPGALIILNLRKLVFTLHVNRPKFLRLTVQGARHRPGL